MLVILNMRKRKKQTNKQIALNYNWTFSTQKFINEIKFAVSSNQEFTTNIQKITAK